MMAAPCSRILATVFVTLLAGSLVAGCDTAVEPIQPGAPPFSLFGALDASADTQFVRVTPIRPTFEATPGPIDARVVLEDLQSGETAVWRDSLVEIRGRPAHVFWSTAPVRPRRSYRLTATRSDGAASSATVAVPDSFPVPGLQAEALIRGADGRVVLGQQVVVRGVARLVDLRVRYGVVFSDEPDVVRSAEVIHMDRVSSGSGFHSVGFLAGDDLRSVAAARPGAAMSVRWVEVTVSGAGPEWPELTAEELEALGLPGSAGNVENGVGFVGGVVSQTWPFCELRSGLGGAECTRCEIEELLGGPPCPP